MKKIILLFLILFFLNSCKVKSIDYIEYYNKTLAIDSILRFEKDTLTCIKKYKKHFRKYGIHNQERLREFEVYVLLSHKKNKKFGGKRRLYRLIDLITPYKERYKNYSFFCYYGIDSIKIAKRFKRNEDKYNQILIDSFRIAIARDQSSRENGFSSYTKNEDIKNVKLFKWAIKNHGFPSTEKVGSVDFWQNNSFYTTMLTHFIYLDEYSFFKDSLFYYVKSGECNPYSYSQMIDRHDMVIEKKESYYNCLKTFDKEFSSSDSIEINKRRKTIGLPSLKHTVLIPSDRTQILILK